MRHDMMPQCSALRSSRDRDDIRGKTVYRTQAVACIYFDVGVISLPSLFEAAHNGLPSSTLSRSGGWTKLRCILEQASRD